MSLFNRPEGCAQQAAPGVETSLRDAYPEPML
jgi:hypothetical protein